MSMPIIIPSTTTRDQAVTDLIASVALEETALSHILNAEGEKLQVFIAIQSVTPEELLSVNKSVQSMVNAVTRLEMVLQAKLELVSCEFCAN
ncbi:MAG: hypothetical protein RR056_06325 [Acetivibrio sp.]